MALDWPVLLKDLRARVAAVIQAGKEWVIPEDEAMAECGLDMVLDGGDVDRIVADLAAYFGLGSPHAKRVGALLADIQRQHLADRDAQAERRQWALASRGELQWRPPQ